MFCFLHRDTLYPCRGCCIITGCLHENEKSLNVMCKTVDARFWYVFNTLLFNVFLFVLYLFVLIQFKPPATVDRFPNTSCHAHSRMWNETHKIKQRHPYVCIVMTLLWMCKLPLLPLPLRLLWLYRNISIYFVLRYPLFIYVSFFLCTAIEYLFAVSTQFIVLHFNILSWKFILYLFSYFFWCVFLLEQSDCEILWSSYCTD